MEYWSRETLPKKEKKKIDDFYFELNLFPWFFVVFCLTNYQNWSKLLIPEKENLLIGVLWIQSENENKFAFSKIVIFFLILLISCSQYPDIVIVEDDNEDEYAPVIQSTDQNELARESLSLGSAGSSPLMSSAVQINGSSGLTSEDPVTMMDSILNDNINLLGKWVFI